MKKYESPEISLKKYTLTEIIASLSAEEAFDNVVDGDLVWGDEY